MNNLFFLGDIHGEFHILENAILGHCNQDVIIQVGDFGMGFINSLSYSCLDNVVKALNDTDSVLYCIRGNHDDPRFWNIEYCYENRIFFVPDFTTLNILGKNFYFVGGAISIDRRGRTEGFNYWTDEGVDFSKWKTNKPVNKIDVLVSHSAPFNFYPYGAESKMVVSYCKEDPLLKEDLILERTFLKQVFDYCNPAECYYGHFHDSNLDVFGETKCRLLDINEIYMAF